MAYLTPSPKMQFFTANGIPLVGGKLYTYEAGTTTPLATYVDQAGSSSNPNPVIMDSRGEANVWLANAVLYDFVLKDSADVLIWTGTNVGNAGSNPLASTFKVQNFSGDGTTVAFVLTYEPPNENNTQIYINGAYQQKNTYSLAASTITFSSAPPLGTDNIEVMTIATLSFGYIDSSLVNYIPSGIGAVPTTVQAKLYEVVSVLDFGADPTGVADSSAAFGKALTQAYTKGFGVVVPNGTYKILDRSAFPRQNSAIAPVNIIAGQNVVYTGTIVPGVFTSAPAFGASVVNGYNLTTYSYLYSAPNQAVQDPGALGTYPFGSATLSVDCVPGTSFRGNADAAFFESRGVSGANCALGGVNVVSEMSAGFLGNANCMELDLSNLAGDLKGLGMVLTGQGTYRPEVGVKMLRAAYGTQTGTGVGGWIPAYQFGLQLYNVENGIYIDQSQVQTPASAIAVIPGPQAVATNPSIYVRDPVSGLLFQVQNDGYLAYRSSSPISSLGTNVVAGTAPNSPSVYLMSDKTVRLSGKIIAAPATTVTAGTTLATLPVAFRPNRAVYLPLATDALTIVGISIDTSGNIKCGSNLTNTSYFDLSSITYLLNN